MKRLVILTGLSGSGKTTIAERLLATSRLKRVVTHTTRPRREGEVDGEAYHFVSREGFQVMVNAGTMLEHAEVYGNMYGTSQEALQDVFDSGCDALLILDIQGALWWQKHYEGESKIFFVSPPDLGVLEDRLRERNTDSEETIQRRLDEALTEVSYCRAFTAMVINDDLALAVSEIREYLGYE